MTNKHKEGFADPLRVSRKEKRRHKEMKEKIKQQRLQEEGKIATTDEDRKKQLTMELSRLSHLPHPDAQQRRRKLEIEEILAAVRGKESETSDSDSSSASEEDENQHKLVRLAGVAAAPDATGAVDSGSVWANYFALQPHASAVPPTAAHEGQKFVPRAVVARENKPPTAASSAPPATQPSNATSLDDFFCAVEGVG